MSTGEGIALAVLAVIFLVGDLAHAPTAAALNCSNLSDIWASPGVSAAGAAD
jgi:hypothetical protein